MENDPLTTFGLLWKACVSDDNDSRASLITATAVSFALGMVASVATAYFLGVSHLIV
jgi:hypothetical protein